MADNGLIIYFEGPDGIGKTAQLTHAAEALRAKGRTVYETRTMGGTPIGELLRAALLSPSERPVETDLHIALATQHALVQEVLERREKGEIVLIDRSPLSIIGYQVYGDALDRTAGYQAVGELLDLFQPDLMLNYTADPDLLEARRQQRNHLTGHDYFESKPVDFHQKVNEGLLVAAKHFGAKVVNADDDIEAVHRETMKHILPLLKT